jgi:hypothetical protein
VVQNDTRSGEENKKEYGISDVKMIDIKKRWQDLNSFWNRGFFMQNVWVRVASPSGLLFMSWAESLQLGRVRCGVDQASKPFSFSFVSLFLQNRDLAKFTKNHIEK